MQENTTIKDLNMDFSLEEIDTGVIVINFTGRLDAQGAETLNARLSELLENNGHLIIANLAGVSQLPSPGIRFLLKFALYIKERGGKLVIAAPQPQVEYALCVAGVDTEIKIFASLNRARGEI